MHRTIIVGSPRESGRSASLASQIFDACIDECPQDGISVVSVAGMEISGCIGCDLCRNAKDDSLADDVSRSGDGPTGEVVEDGEAYATDAGASDKAEAFEAAAQDEYRLAQNDVVAKSDASLHRCFMHDDMRVVREHIDAADELIVVCPVYFAGAPSQAKALMDRLQPYYWSNLRKAQKRPMALHIVGEGNDPHGFEPLIGSVRSAFAVAGFSLDVVFDWVGCIDRTGEIMLDAEEIRFDG